MELKKVFQAKLEIVFMDDARKLAHGDEMRFSFVSNEGIMGDLIIKKAELNSNTNLSCIIQIETEMKRMFLDLEGYLRCISEVLGAETKNSVMKIVNVRDVFMRTFNDLEIVKEKGDLKVAKDLDNTFYLVNPHAIQKVLNHFDNQIQAEAALAFEK